ncbi:hypothetical protein Tco_1465607 [Tanacetum coccineum]
MKAIKKVLRYVKGTKDYGITYKHNGGNKIYGYSDSSYGVNTQEEKYRSNNCLVENRVSGGFKYNESLDTSSNFDMLLNDYDGVNGFISAAAESEGRSSFYDVEESHEQVFSPPFLMDASLSADSFEDLLAPLSETETALMEH